MRNNPVQIGHSSRAEIVDDHYLVPIGDQHFGQVTTDKARAARYQRPHCSLPVPVANKDRPVLDKVNMIHQTLLQIVQVAVHLVHAAVLAALVDIQSITDEMKAGLFWDPARSTGKSARRYSHSKSACPAGRHCTH